jgi:acid phosphatase
MEGGAPRVRGGKVRSLKAFIVGMLVVAGLVLPLALTGYRRAPDRPLAAGQTLHERRTSRRADSTGRPAPATKPRASAPPHVVLIVEENHGFGQIIGSRSAPFINHLAANGTLLTHYDAITHPSLPNYIALIAGSALGIHRDCRTCQIPGTNLIDQLQAARISWKAYYQGLPAAGSSVTSAGAYTKSVDPFLHFSDISTAPARARRVVPFSQLRVDLLRNRLPSFVVISPDLHHDMHSGTVASGDAFLRRLYRELRAAPALRGKLRLVVTFDEGKQGRGVAPVQGGGRVATIVVGSGVQGGTRDATPYNHYALLHSIEQLFGLPPLRHAADPGIATIPAVTGLQAAITAGQR